MYRGKHRKTWTYIYPLIHSFYLLRTGIKTKGVTPICTYTCTSTCSETGWHRRFRYHDDDDDDDYKEGDDDEYEQFLLRFVQKKIRTTYYS